MGNIFYFLLLSSIWLAPLRWAGEGVTLTIQLRAEDGTPLVGEPVILEQLPDAAALGPECQTNQEGLCIWLVAPGLYQVRFPAYTLDDLSALALAEGGFSGLGVTVGDEPITYHFTRQEDGHVYFDADPDSPRPSPRIPSRLGLSGGVAMTPTLLLSPEPEATALVNTLLPESEVSLSQPRSAVLVWIGSGLLLGLVGWTAFQYLNGSLTMPERHQKKD